MRDLKTMDKFRLWEMEILMYGRNGGSGEGCFKVFVDGKSFLAIASTGLGWDHVSVSPWSEKRKTCPTWEEMCAVKDLFFLDDERVVQFHPPREEYVNRHPYCLHLWRPNRGAEMPHPPIEMV